MRTHFYRVKYVFLRYFLANKYCQRIQKSGQNYIKNAKKCNENKKILLRSNFSKLFYSIRILGCVSAPSNDSPMPYTQPHQCCNRAGYARAIWERVRKHQLAPPRLKDREKHFQPLLPLGAKGDVAAEHYAYTHKCESGILGHACNII